jgi:nitroreductase
MQLDKVTDKRCSIREFSSKPVKYADVLEAIDAACQAPFAGNINNLHFVIVEDQEQKNKITQCCQQDWIADSPLLVVVCSDEAPLERMYETRGAIYSRQQAGAAIENFLLKITDLGLSSCWVGAYTDDQIRAYLKIPENINIEAVLPVGYMSKTCKPKKSKKAPLNNKIFWGSWMTRKKPLKSKDPTTFEGGGSFFNP